MARCGWIGVLVLAVAGCVAPAPVAQLSDLQILTVSGNEKDLAWMVAREPGKTRDGEDYERKVLLCYRLREGNPGIELLDVREITWDIKMVQLGESGQKSLSVRRVYENWKQSLNRSPAEGGKAK